VRRDAPPSASSASSPSEVADATCVHVLWKPRGTENWWPLTISYVFGDGKPGPFVMMLAGRKGRGAKREGLQLWAEAREQWEQRALALKAQNVGERPLRRGDFDRARDLMQAKFQQFTRRILLDRAHLEPHLEKMHFRPWRPAGWLTETPMEAYFSSLRQESVPWLSVQAAFERAGWGLPADAPAVALVAETMALFPRALPYVGDAEAPGGIQDWQYPPSLGVLAGDCDDLGYAAARCWPLFWVSDLWTAREVPEALREVASAYLPFMAVVTLHQGEEPPASHAYCVLLHRAYLGGTKRLPSQPAFAFAEGTRYAYPLSAKSTAGELRLEDEQPYLVAEYGAITDLLPIDPVGFWGEPPFVGAYEAATRQSDGSYRTGARVSALLAGDPDVRFEPVRVYDTAEELHALQMVASAIPRLPALSVTRLGTRPPAALDLSGTRFVTRTAGPSRPGMHDLALRFRAGDATVDMHEHIAFAAGD